MIALNEKAWVELEKTISRADRLGIHVQTMSCGTMVLDAGVHVRGGMAAGLAMARIGMAGLADIQLLAATVGNLIWPEVHVQSDAPLEACFLSQSAHWQVDAGGFQGMGSGPACLLNSQLDVGKPIGFKEKTARAVLVLEGHALPGDGVCQVLAQQCGVAPEQLAIIAAPTSSLAGCVQITARSIETALHKLHTLQFDLKGITSAMGTCPVAQPTGDDLTSLGQTNDVMMCGSRVWLATKGVPDSEIKKIIKKIPASSSPAFGKPFLEALKAAGGFYNMDPGLFAPAEITINSLDSGAVFQAGRVDVEYLLKIIKGKS